MTVIVTGAAGFIGRAVAERLLRDGYEVVGVDNFNTYYDPALKLARAATLSGQAGFEMVTLDIADTDGLGRLVQDVNPEYMVHLAAQAGVRYSIEKPFAYSRSNLLGHLSVLEACRHAPGLKHLVYASSSSVYGDRPMGGTGFTEAEAADTPASLYAATKRSCELMSASYAHLYDLPQSGLRFFTVYGPWGRPDMAYYSFTQKILAGDPIEVFGEGQMARDFTYIDDIVDGVVGVMTRPSSLAKDGRHQIYNIGDSRPVGLMRMIEVLEQTLGRTATKVMRPMQAGDVTATFADVSKLSALTGYAPRVTLEAGLPLFANWYREYRRL
jgi:UDP-glucuronate 4-epimerase